LAEFSDGDYGAFVVFQERETQDPTEPGGATTTAGETAERDTMAATTADDDGSGILIDPDSGIPEDEQREILVQISGIYQRNRRSLSAGMEAGKRSRRRFKARKNGGLFLILVNVIAVLALAGGLFALNSVQTEADVRAREGTRVFNSMERTLIYEIRRETSALLLTTDEEIAILTALLVAVENQLYELLSGDEALAQEQMATEERLLGDRDYYRGRLAFLRGERSRILDESRSRELLLQAQREVRIQEAILQKQLEAAAREAAFLGQIEAPAQELTLQEQLSRIRGMVWPEAGRELVPGEALAEFDTARDELSRLAREQARIARVENQIAAFFEAAHRRVVEGRFAEAERTIRRDAGIPARPRFPGAQRHTGQEGSLPDGGRRAPNAVGRKPRYRRGAGCHPGDPGRRRGARRGGPVARRTAGRAGTRVATGGGCRDAAAVGTAGRASSRVATGGNRRGLATTGNPRRYVATRQGYRDKAAAGNRQAPG